MTPDYGMDLRVEDFDSRGNPSGRSFYVQLKATDRADTNRHRYVDVKASHYYYWHSLSDPVLIVVYFRKSGVFYAQWAHRMHPRPDPKEPARRVATKRFRLAEHTRWRASSASRVIDEVALVRDLAHGIFRLPATVGVSGENGIPNALSREVIEQLPNGLVEWREVRDTAVGPHLYVETRALVVRVGKTMLSVSAVVSPEDSPPRASEAPLPSQWFADMSITLLAAAVGGAGAAQQACRLIREAPPSTIGATVVAMTQPPFLSTIGKAGDFDLALDLRDKWASMDTRDFLAPTMQIHAMLESVWYERLSTSQRERLAVAPGPPLSVAEHVDVLKEIRKTLNDDGHHESALQLAATIIRLEAGKTSPRDWLEYLDSALKCGDLRRAREWMSLAVETAAESEVGGTREVDDPDREAAGGVDDVGPAQRGAVHSANPWAVDGLAGDLTILSARLHLALEDLEAALLQSMLVAAETHSARAYMLFAALGLLRSVCDEQAEDPGLMSDASVEPWDLEDMVETLLVSGDRASGKAIRAALAANPFSIDAQRLAYIEAVGDRMSVLFALPLSVTEWSDPEWWSMVFAFSFESGHIEWAFVALEFMAEVFGIEKFERIDTSQLMGRAADVFDHLWPEMIAAKSKGEPCVINPVDLRERRAEEFLGPEAGRTLYAHYYEVQIGERIRIRLGSNRTLVDLAGVAERCAAFRRSVGLEQGQSAVVISDKTATEGVSFKSEGRTRRNLRFARLAPPKT